MLAAEWHNTKRSGWKHSSQELLRIPAANEAMADILDTWNSYYVIERELPENDA